MDEDQINEILLNHGDKDFVKRIINPENAPTYDFGGGNWGTHKMGYVSTENERGEKEYHVFPSLMRDEKDASKLKDYGRNAYKVAKDRGEYISFNDEATAADFGKNYKKVWGKGWRKGEKGGVEKGKDANDGE